METEEQEQVAGADRDGGEPVPIRRMVGPRALRVRRFRG